RTVAGDLMQGSDLRQAHRIIDQRTLPVGAMYEGGEHVGLRIVQGNRDAVNDAGIALDHFVHELEFLPEGAALVQLALKVERLQCGLQQANHGSSEIRDCGVKTGVTISSTIACARLFPRVCWPWRGWR